VTFANAGLGAANHLCGMLFQTAIATKLTAVPYRGGGPLLNDLLGGQVDLACEQATTSTGPISAKRVKAYAVTTKTRLKSLPELPTADEAGLKGFEIGVWSIPTARRIGASRAAAASRRDHRDRPRDR